jgi:RND superfamily putative drug exporter
MQRVLTYPATPTGKWVVLAVWVVAIVAIIGTGLPGKFADAEKNESRSFLPGDVESTAALEITEELAGAETAPTVIAYGRDGGLTAQDKQTIERDLQRLNEATKEFKNTTPFGNPEGREARTPFQLSEDGKVALISNIIKSDGSGESSTILDPVDKYRELVSKDPPDGLEVKVTGPAGVSADAIKVFEGINGALIGAAFSLVIFLLIIIYRSPRFWLLPISAVVFAEIAARGGGWLLTELGVTVNGQSSSILSVLVIGAGTDYALLLVARYREELRRHQDPHEAMQLALKSAGPAILASGATVMVALLTLMLAKVNGTAGLGPTGAMGIFVAVLVMLTFLPALLTWRGRKPFWPFVPYGPDDVVPTTGFAARMHARDKAVDETHGLWRRVGDRVARRSRLVTAVSLLALAVMALGLLNYSNGLTQSNTFRDSVESIEGQELIATSFPEGQSAPTDIVLRPGDRDEVEAVARAASQIEGVAAVPPQPVAEGDSGIQLAAFLDVDPYSEDAFDAIPKLRKAVSEAAPGTLVGGPSAIEYDLRQANVDDTQLIVPLVLVLVFLILVMLLRAVVAPLLLIVTVVISFLAALGVGAIVFDVIFGFPGSEPSIPLYAFIFLVALGVDYNIFLMARVREEALKHGTRDGMLRAVAVTGGVITSAGIVLAGTFTVLAVLPLTFLTEIGFVVAFGVLLDTFLVRSVLVPALVFDIGPKVWWPSKLAKTDGGDGGAPLAAPEERETAPV